MIKKLSINNFRSHKKTELEFVNGINCIIGDPDSGKSNVIRSINWLLTNRPLGFRFHSDFIDGDTSVKMTFDQDQFIALNKNKKEASYYIGNDEADITDKLKAIGSDVPDAINKIANMSDINLQKQLDKPFLICSSSAEVAKIFNKITNLEKVDLAISKITTDINSANKELRILEADEKDIALKLEELGDVESMIDDFKAIFIIDKRIKEISPALITVEKIVKDVNQYDEEINSLKNLVEKAQSALDGIVVIAEEIKKMSKEMSTLENIIEAIKDLDNSIRKLGKISDKANEDLTDMIIAIESMKLEETRIKDVNKIIGKCKDTDKSINEWKEELADQIDNYKRFLLKVNECPFCDLCKTDISKHNFDSFLKDYRI